MKEIFVLLADLDLRAWFRPPGQSLPPAAPFHPPSAGEKAMIS